MTKRILLPLLLAAFVLTACLGASAQGLNGTDPRPFYVVAHNPNTLSDADSALQCSQPGDPCANAVEPDVNVLPTSCPIPPYDAFTGEPDPPGLVMYHDDVCITSRVPLTLVEYLKGLHNLAIKHPQLSMVLLDVKKNAAKPWYGSEILTDVRTYLNTDGVNLNVIISTGDRDDEKLFDNIVGILGEREGVQVDEDNRPDLVVGDFLTLFGGNIVNVNDGNIGYGDGTLTLGPNMPRAVDWASFLQASTGYPKVISDVFTILEKSMMSFYIDAGADGVIPDLPDPFHPEFDENLTVGYIKDLQEVVKQHPELRLATRDDNPFKPENQAYGLEVTTLDIDTGGTDAPLTFTLEGCRGTAEVTVHTGEAPNGLMGTGRMERGNTDHVTIPSLDLGKLTKLHVKNNGGAANAPDWALGTVAVSSARWLFPDSAHQFEYKANFNKFVFADKTEDIDLTANFPEPKPTIDCPGPMEVSNDPGKCSAVVNFSTPAAGMCNDVTTSSTPKSGTAFDVGLTDVTATATSPTTGTNSCSFKVTVKDVEAPLISCPGPQVASATSPQGVIVNFSTLAGDNCSASVTSAPASGSEFAIGDTLVTSVAQDPSGNQSSCSFNVHVKGAAEQLTDLTTAVNNLDTKQGTKNSLLAKLSNALAKVTGQNNGPACNELSSFVNEVSAQAGKDISAADADSLIKAANQIRAVLGC